MRTVLSEQHVCGSCGRPVMYLDFGGRIVVCEGRVAIGGPTILLNTHRCLDAVSFVGVAADGSTPLPEWIVAAIGGTTILLNTHRCCDAVSFVGVAADGSTPLPEWIVGRIHETLAASPFGLTLSEIRARAFRIDLRHLRLASGHRAASQRPGRRCGRWRRPFVEPGLQDQPRGVRGGGGARVGAQRKSRAWGQCFGGDPQARHSRLFPTYLIVHGL